MPGARLHDDHDDRRPVEPASDPTQDFEVPEVDVEASTPDADEPPVDKAPEEQEDA